MSRDSLPGERPAHAATSSSETMIDWRVRRLKAVGFEPQLARELASDCGVDLHAVLELTDRGCPPALAARIVAPLDRPRS